MPRAESSLQAQLIQPRPVPEGDVRLALQNAVLSATTDVLGESVPVQKSVAVITPTAGLERGASNTELHESHSKFDFGDKLLVLLFALLSTLLLGFALVPGWESAHAKVCDAKVENCTYRVGFAVDHRMLPLAASMQAQREGCCDACQKHPNCGAATFLDANATARDPTPYNCFIYPVSSMHSVAQEQDASLCSPLTEGASSMARLRGWVQEKMETLLGASAMLSRFASFAMMFVQAWLLRKIGYGGAGIGQTILKPRQAAALAATFAMREAADDIDATDEQASAVQMVAGWEAIAGDPQLFYISPTTTLVAQPRLLVDEEQVEVAFGFGQHEHTFDCTVQVATLSSANLEGKLAVTYFGEPAAAGGYTALADRANQAAGAAAVALIVVDDHLWTRNCPASHVLLASKSEHMMVCDVCCEDIPANAWLYGCRECDYDLCVSCSSQATPDVTTQLKTTIPVFVVGEMAGEALLAATQVRLTMPAFAKEGPTVDHPPTWTEARIALGLSVRQAVWSSGAKLLIWHWSQPLSYFAVFGTYYCSLVGDTHDHHTNQRSLGTLVAIREALYIVSTLLALWLNPAYLLLELESVLRPADEAKDGRCCLVLRRLNGVALKRWALYLLAPHHYVMMCLSRWAKTQRGAQGVSGHRKVCLIFSFTGGMPAIFDACSAGGLYRLLQMPSPPAALAFGYWLTTAGIVLFVGAFADHWCGLGFSMMRGSVSCQQRLFSGLFLVVGVPALGFMFGLCAVPLVVAPLQLGGAVGGFACHGSSYWSPESWICS
jgi:hypothetical protein